MIGYKVFNKDWTCRRFQYKVGESYEIDKEPKVCNTGFHFCLKVSDCFNFYDFTYENKVAEVEAYGDIDQEEDGSKYCTNKIRIVREITWDEVLRFVNEGKSCTGFCNTGFCNTGDYNTGDHNTSDRNTGNYNTGNYNTGDRNTGDWNTGDRNTDDRNTGNYNTGNHNIGNRNTGDQNTGNHNTGDWNTVSFSTGCFNTKTQKITLFNKPCDLMFWYNSKGRQLLSSIPKGVVEWVPLYNMTDEEKALYPTYKTTRGYLKILDDSECAQLWWDCLCEEDRQVIFDLPNFDADIFKECTGINVY